MPPEDVLHPVFYLELALLESDFFDLFGFREVMLGGQLVQSVFKFVVFGKEGVEFFVGLQQLILQVLLPIHAAPPWDIVRRVSAEN
jgi:hypothetical protein